MIYFDNAATTPLSETARAEMLSTMEIFGNPSSLHSLGLAAERCIKGAAEVLAQIIHADPNGIIFTSGGTESNNLAILGAASLHRRGRIITTLAEHPSVAEPIKMLNRQSKTEFEVVYAPTAAGVVDPAQLAELITPETILVSVMHVNNETGAINDIEAIGRAIKSRNPNTLFHSDCVQSFTKHGIDVARAKIDLLAASGHKLGAPKGTGLLYVAKGTRLKPITYGGGQNRNLRPGTENTMCIAAFAAAAKFAHTNSVDNLAHIKAINAYLRNALQADDYLKIASVVNSPTDASPYILNVSFPGKKPEVLMRLLEERGVYVSPGAACSLKAGKKSAQDHGLPKHLAETSIRFSFSPQNTLDEVAHAVECLKQVR